MKKAIIMTLAVFFVAGSTAFAFPQYGQDGGNQGAPGQGGGSGAPGGGPRGGMGMYGAENPQMAAVHAKMMNSMMLRPVGVSQSGDVFILSGNTLQKYDSNLNLVKEHEIQADLFGGAAGGMPPAMPAAGADQTKKS